MPVQVTTLTAAVAIGGGLMHTLAVLGDGTAWAWGRGSAGQLGDGLGANSDVPVQVIDLHENV